MAFALCIVTASMSLAPARAQETKTHGCVSSRLSFDCLTRWAPAGDPFIRMVPAPADAAAKARATERDRRWVSRCRPFIRPDRYGVARYHYALPGCEFGLGE